MAHKCKITPGKTENQLGMYFFTPPPLRASFFFFSKGWFVQWSPKSMIAPPQKVFLRKVSIIIFQVLQCLATPKSSHQTISTISKTLRSVHKLQGCHILPKVSPRGKDAGDDWRPIYPRPLEVELVPHVFAHWPARVRWSSPVAVAKEVPKLCRRKWQGVKVAGFLFWFDEKKAEKIQQVLEDSVASWANSGLLQRWSACNTAKTCWQRTAKLTIWI